MRMRNGGAMVRACAMMLITAILCTGAVLASTPPQGDEQTALSLAELLRAARGVISAKQDLINDPNIGAKGLTGAVVLAEAQHRYRQATGEDLTGIDKATRYGRAMSALQEAIVEVTDEHQSTINSPGVGFKGFIPAVFARLVNERFDELMQGEAKMKVTAPRDLVRNRKALPDAWEGEIINARLLSPDWPHGKPVTATTDADGRQAFRLLIPEYYQSSCLVCHGAPKGEMDLTGYPKEGGAEGELGAVISVTLYQ